MKKVGFAWLLAGVVMAQLCGSNVALASSAVSPATLATDLGHVGQPYNAPLTFMPGATWRVVAGELPPGLSVSSGAVAGVPTQPGSYTFTVLATSGTASAQRMYSIFISPDTAYDTRVDAVMQDHITHPWPPLSGSTYAIGALNLALAELWLNTNLADADSKLAQVKISDIAQDPSGMCRGNLWLSYLLRPYLLFGPGSSFFPNRMSQTAANNLVAQMSTWAKSCSLLSLNDGAWTIHDSENHDAQSKAIDLLAAQTFMNLPGYSGLTYSDGSTVAQQYAAWDKHWNDYFDERAKRGFFIETGSATYVGYTIQAILEIYQFAQDPLLRQKAGMILDLTFAEAAQQSLGNVAGGPESRSYPPNYDATNDPVTDFADLLYGGPLAHGNHITALATSGYYPPAVVRALHDDPAGRGSFDSTVRRPGVGPSGWDNMDWNVDPNQSVVDYTYTTPDYVMGTAELQPGMSHIGPSNQNRWSGIIFNATPSDRVYPQAAPSSVDKEQDAFWAVQRQNVLITSKNGITDQPTLVYFPSTLDVLQESNGWLFVQEGSAYLAVRPIGGYTWLTGAKNQDSNIDNRFIRLNSVSAPIIFDAGRTADFTSLAAFEAKIKSNPLTDASGVLTYTGSTGTKLTFAGGTTPLVNGVPINWEPTNVFNSIHLRSIWLSGKFTVSEGALTATYDFSNSANPVKTAS